MIIKSIELADYRNYDSLVLQFDRGTNILYGDNAQGKTNILEAVYESGTSRSHRSSKRISWKQSMLLPPQNRIKEARTEKLLILTRKRHILERISKKMEKRSAWTCI